MQTLFYRQRTMPCLFKPQPQQHLGACADDCNIAEEISAGSCPAMQHLHSSTRGKPSTLSPQPMPPCKAKEHKRVPKEGTGTINNCRHTSLQTTGMGRIALLKQGQLCLSCMVQARKTPSGQEQTLLCTSLILQDRNIPYISPWWGRT